MKRIAVIRGYAADARHYAEAGENLGYIPKQKHIPAPYAYSPTHRVYEWKGNKVIHVEVKHRQYEIYDVSDLMIFPKEKEAENLYINSL
jgi:hypothetical protein